MATLPGRARPARAAILSLVVATAAFLLPARLAAVEEWYDQYNRRTLQAADDAEFADLVENPSGLDFDLQDEPSQDIVVESFADVHAVYPVSFEALRDTILDLDSHKDFVPNVASSDAQPTGDDPPSWRQKVELEFRLVVFSADYSFETEHLVPHRSDDDIVLVFRMVRSHDEMIANTGGSWYLKRIEIDGDEHTYARYFNHVAFGDHIFGLRFALRNFGLRDIKSVMDSFYREALNRVE